MVDPAVYVAEAQSEAQRLLEEARDTATKLVEQARADTDAIRQQAYDEGYRAGLEQGRADGLVEGHRQFDEQIEEARQIAATIKQSHQEWLASMPNALTELVMAALKHLLLRELELAPANLEQHVMHLLQHVSDAAELEIHVHPEDFQAAKEAHGTWQSSRYGSFVLNIVPDTGIHRGGAEVRSVTGRVDGTIETQLSRLKDVLSEVIERGQDDAFSEPISGEAGRSQSL